MDSIPDDIRGKRDKAAVLLGYNGALRRSEIVGLDAAKAPAEELNNLEQREQRKYLGHIQQREGGLIVNLQWAKTDQSGSGKDVWISHDTVNLQYCAVCAVDDWMSSAGIESGPLFRHINRHEAISDKRLSTHGLNLILKTRIKELQKQLEKRVQAGQMLTATEAGWLKYGNEFSAHGLRS